MKGLFEILTEKKWMISPDFVHGMKKALEQNLNTHAAFSKPQKTCGFVTATTPMGETYYPEEYQISEDGKLVRGNWALDDDKYQTFPFVSVLTVDGPITRNGGGCSYGSIDHRDMMIRAANHPLCRGHLFIINTPGGSAWAKNDYQQAIEYARSLGQPVFAFIDGMCASAGMYLASLCDERYYMHPKDEIGCIGVMAAFYTQADGSKNQFTDETYHELYDPESFDKNREFRDVANDGNTKALVKELAELGVEFRADVKAACPNAKDKHLHGKVFNAEDVKGILMDDQSDFFACIKRCFDLYNGVAQPISREASSDDEEPEDEPTNDPTTDPTNEPGSDPKGNQASAATAPHSVGKKTQQDNNPKQDNNSKSFINMANYPLISAALNLKEGELAVKEDGAFMNAPLLDTLEAHLNTTKQQVVDAQQKTTQAEQSLKDLQAKFDTINAQLASAQEAKAAAEKALTDANEAHAAEIANIKAEHTDAIAKKDETIAQKDETIAQKDEEIKNLSADKSKADDELKGAKEALATAEQTIADKDAQIAALGTDPGNEPEAGAAPENNGEGAKVQSLREFDPSLYKTNKERKEAFERFKRGEA